MKRNYSDSMKISEIKRGESNITIQAKVIDVSDSRDVQTKYGKRSVADATLEDDSGQITLTLWEEKIGSVKIGDVISVAGAYVTEFRDKLQLNIPRTGKIEIVKE
jgi:ssDNA-binding replication factor A large subunit